MGFNGLTAITNLFNHGQASADNGNLPDDLGAVSKGDLENMSNDELNELDQIMKDAKAAATKQNHEATEVLTMIEEERIFRALDELDELDRQIEEGKENMKNSN